MMRLGAAGKRRRSRRIGWLIFFVPALLMLVLKLGQAQATPGFVISATLRDGTAVSGSLPKDTVEFLAVSSSHEIVKVNIQTASEPMDNKAVCEVEWLPDRNVFVIRQAAWTGELVRLWDKLNFLGKDGNPATIRGEDVKEIRFLRMGQSDKAIERER